MNPHRTIDNLTFKNNVFREGSWLHIELPTYPAPSWVVCNFSDAELLAPHRWRMAGDRIVTVVDNAIGVPEIWPIESIILRRPRTDKIPHKNGELLDCRRVNLEAPRQKATLPPTPITVKGNEAMIHCPNGKTVLIDRDDIEKCKAYRWLIFDKGAGSTPYYEVRCKAPTDDNPNRSLLLYRLILALPAGGRHQCQFRNGNRLDMRKSNIFLKSNANDED